MDHRTTVGKGRWARLLALAGVVVVVGCSDEAPDAVESAQGFLAAPLAGSVDPGTGLSVVASRSQTIAADEALVVVTAQFDEFTGTGGEFDESAREEIRSALDGLGIEDEAVMITSSSLSGAGFFEGDEVRVESPVEGLADRADEITDAVENAVDEVGETGVRFYLSDCTAALSVLQESTVADAVADASALADAASVTLGDLRTVREVSSPADPFSFVTESSCPDGTSGPLASPDSPPEVRLNYSVEVSYELADADDPGLTAESLGSGSVTDTADEATLVVTTALDDFGVGSVATLDAEASTAVQDAAAELGLATDQIRFINGDEFNGTPTMITIPVDVGQLSNVGEEFVDAVGDAIDEDVDGGVVFRSSRCVELLADARALAIEDAGTRIAGLGQGTPEAVVLLLEQPGDGLGFDLSPCDPERLPTNEYGEPDVSSFDARPEVTVRAAVVVGRALA